MITGLAKGLFLLWLIWGWIFNRMLLFVVLIIEFLIASGEALYGQQTQLPAATNGSNWNIVNILIAGISGVSTVCVTLFYINQQLHGEIRKLTQSALEAQNVNRELTKATEVNTRALLDLKEEHRQNTVALAGLREAIAGLKPR